MNPPHRDGRILVHGVVSIKDSDSKSQPTQELKQRASTEQVPGGARWSGKRRAKDTLSRISLGSPRSELLGAMDFSPHAGSTLVAPLRPRRSPLHRGPAREELRLAFEGRLPAQDDRGQDSPSGLRLLLH